MIGQKFNRIYNSAHVLDLQLTLHQKLKEAGGREGGQLNFINKNLSTDEVSLSEKNTSSRFCSRADGSNSSRFMVCSIYLKSVEGFLTTMCHMIIWASVKGGM